MTAHSLREKPSLRSLDDYRLLCEEWSWSIPENYNIAADCVDKHASDPDRRDHPALVWESASGQSRRYSFGELICRFGHRGSTGAAPPSAVQFSPWSYHSWCVGTPA